MSAVALDPVIEAWLGGLRLADKTISTYRQHIGVFQEWLNSVDIPIHEVTEDDLARYSGWLYTTGVSVATMTLRFTSVRVLYAWLYKTRRIDRDPAVDFFPRTRHKHIRRDVLSLRDLRRLLSKATDPTSRAVLLLIMVNALGPDEILTIKITDVTTTDGLHTLRLHDGRHVPLPDLVAGPVFDVIGDRQRGQLLLNKWGSPMTAPNMRLLLRKAATEARLGVPLNFKLLIASVRVIAMTEQVSTVSLMQAFGFGTYRNLVDVARHLPEAPQHLAYRLATLLRPDADSTAALLDQADALAAHHGLPQSARVMVAGAAFERHLRLLAIRDKALPPDTERTQIGSLTGILIGAKVIKKTDEKICVHVGTVRDWAAHGWFEKVTEDVANTFMADLRRLVAAYPL
jgi:site-specific recombinase XerD